MSAGWVAGQVRAVALLKRTLDIPGARELATAGSLAEAQHLLGASAYGRSIVVGAAPAATDHAIAAETLWWLRVLAGWQPREGAVAIRALAGWFEIANIEARARALTGDAPEPEYFELGALASGWGRVRAASSLSQLRAALALTPWGDPGADDLSGIRFGVRVGWAAQVASAAVDLRRCAAGRVALLVAGHRLLGGEPLTEPVARRVRRVLGPEAVEARELDGFRAALPMTARWALSGVDALDELWRAEFRWWSRLDAEGRELVRRRRFDASAGIGAAAVLLADSWRVRAAVQFAAARQHTPEVFDELVG